MVDFEFLLFLPFPVYDVNTFTKNRNISNDIQDISNDLAFTYISRSLAGGGVYTVCTTVQDQDTS